MSIAASAADNEITIAEPKADEHGDQGDGAKKQAEEQQAPTTTLVVTVVKVQNLPCLRLILNEEDTKDDETPVPRSRVAAHVRGAVIKSEVVEDENPTFDAACECPLNGKDPAVLDWLCSTPLNISVAELGTDEAEGVESVCTYNASIDMASLVTGDLELEGWFNLERVSPPTKELQELFVNPILARDHDTEPVVPREQAILKQMEKQARVFVRVRLTNPILTQEEIDTSNIVTITVSHMTGVPAHWLTDYEVLETAEQAKAAEDLSSRGTKGKAGAKKGGKEAKKPPPKGKKGPTSLEVPRHRLTVGYELPLSATRKHNVEHGTLKMQLARAEDFPPQYPEGSLDADDNDTSNTARTTGSKDGKKGAAKGGVDKKAASEKEARQKLREEAEAQSLALRKQNRTVQWSYTRKCFLKQEGVNVFKNNIKSAQRFLFEVTRDLMVQPEDDESGKTMRPEDISFVKGLPGSTEVELRTLLKEGQCRVTGTYSLAMTPDTIQKRHEEIAKAKAGQAEADEKNKKKKKDEEQEDEETPTEPDYYAAKGSQIEVTISLLRPLVPMSTVPKLRPKDLIKPRSPPVRPSPTPTEEFQVEIREMLSFLAKEFCHAADEHGWEEDGSRDRKREMLYNINKGGAYRELKEKLKPSIVKILRMRMAADKQQQGGTLDLSTGIPEEELPRVASQLYMYLLDMLHVTMNKEFQIRAPVPAVTRKMENSIPHQKELKLTDLGSLNPSQLKVLADEKELLEEFSTASEYHQRRVAMSSEGRVENPNVWSPIDCAEHWHDYAMFWLRVGNQEEGQKCLKEAIAIDCNHSLSLLAYLAVLLDKGDLKPAEVFSRALLELHPNTFLICAIDGLYLDRAEEKALSDEAYQSAQDKYEALVETLATADAAAGAGSERSTMQREDPLIRQIFGEKFPEGSLLVHVARYLLSVRCVDLAMFVLQRENETNGGSKWLDLQWAQAYRFLTPNSDHYQAIQSAQQCIAQGKTEGEVIEAFAVFGHVEWENGRFEEAIRAYETYQEWEPETSDPLILCRLGGYYQQQQQWQQAEQVFLRLAQERPSASAWFGVGMSLMEQQQLDQAQRAFEQANLLDNTNPRVWGGLTSLHLLTNNLEAAKKCFRYTLALALNDPSIFRNIGLQYMQKGYLNLALEALTRSLSLQEDVSTLVLLGDVYGALNKADGLLANYQKAYDLLTAASSNDSQEQAESGGSDSELKMAVAKRIVTALFALGRQEEARKYLATD